MADKWIDAALFFAGLGLFLFACIVWSDWKERR